MPDLAATFAPWTKGDEGESSYPYLRLRGNVALIGLASGVPTPPFIASGRLGRQQCEAAAKLLAEAGRAGHVRVVMIHHPPHKGGAALGRALADADEFEAVIRRIGAELIIHGHNHRPVGRPYGRSGSAGAGRRRRLGLGDPRHAWSTAPAIIFSRSRGQPKSPRIRARARGIGPVGKAEIGDLGPIGL